MVGIMEFLSISLLIGMLARKHNIWIRLLLLAAISAMILYETFF